MVEATCFMEDRRVRQEMEGVEIDHKGRERKQEEGERERAPVDFLLPLLFHQLDLAIQA